MNKSCYLFLILFAVCGCTENNFSIEGIQGDWFSNCNDPAVEFSITGNKYSGDFYGSHELTLENNLLIFKNGLVEGHSVEVSFKPKQFKLLDLSKNNMVLEYYSQNNEKIKWKLYSC